MASTDEGRPTETNRNDCSACASTLESAESHLAACPGTGYEGDGGGQAFSASFGALCEWADQRSLIRTEEDFLFFNRQPDGYGNEHQAWFDEGSNRWFKATYHNQFGLAWGRDGTATPREYLTRLVLQNKYFADDIELVCLIQSRQKLRILTSQPHIDGESACVSEIQDWFISLAFIRLQTSDRIAWFRRDENVLIADAHEGNVIKTHAGDLVPIDLNIVQPRGDMLSWACSQADAQCQQ
jgi:Serine/Threonine/Tyrosine Kinase found in polyvalent proteins